MTDAAKEQSAARAAVMECEQEIQNIKAALRQISAVNSCDPNTVEVLFLKVISLTLRVYGFKKYLLSMLYLFISG